MIERGRWYCFEVMVKLNEPGEHDGEQDNTCWFDDVVISTEYIGPIFTGGSPGCDYDGNGESGLLDVIELIRLCRLNPPGPAADYNGDGYCNVRDALSLLIDIVTGKC